MPAKFLYTLVDGADPCILYQIFYVHAGVPVLFLVLRFAVPLFLKVVQINIES